MPYVLLFAGWRGIVLQVPIPLCMSRSGSRRQGCPNPRAIACLGPRGPVRTGWLGRFAVWWPMTRHSAFAFVYPFDSELLKRLEQGLHARFVTPPLADRSGYKWVGGPGPDWLCERPAWSMEFEASRVPFQSQKVDQAAGVGFKIMNQILITNDEPFRRPDALPVLNDPLVVGQSPGNMVPVVGPGVIREIRSPARQGNVAQISVANDHACPRP